MEERATGILLQAIPYLGRGKILKIFTPELGLLSLFSKRISLSALGSPFCIAEWVYRKGTGDLHTFKDGTLLDGLLGLRQSYSHIEAASSIARDLLRSQLPGKNAKGLYELARSYLQKLPEFERPEILSASFRLKLLLHEGLIAIENTCTHCAAQPSFLVGGESYCPAHSPSPVSPFSRAEWETLHTLAYARQFSLLNSQAPPRTLIEKIGRILDGFIE
jgi:DNA repair protein RecO